MWIFDIFDDVVDVADSVVTGAGKKVGRFIDDPVNETVNTVVSPVTNAIEIVDGLTEWELRERAVISLWADVAWPMGTSELIDAYYEWRIQK
jgi:hypothetical protein